MKNKKTIAFWRIPLGVTLDEQVKMAVANDSHLNKSELVDTVLCPQFFYSLFFSCGQFSLSTHKMVVKIKVKVLALLHIEIAVSKS
jgi:hypothetical protein